MRRLLRVVPIVAPCLALGTQPALAQASAIPIHPLGAIVATSSERMSDAAVIRALSDGRVLVNDPGKRRLFLLDSTLRQAAVVADTTSATAKAYGDGLPWLIPFTGDSSLVLDRITNAFLVISPAGTVARIIPKPSGANRGGDRPLGTPFGFDHAGHLLYHATQPFFLGLLPQDFVGDTLMKGPDSLAILREDLTTRRVDTLAMLQAPRVRQAVTRRLNGGSGRPALNPIQSGDDWTMLTDGTLAIVRVHDYRIDWIGRDGRATSGPKIPTQWVRLTDSMKVAMMNQFQRADSAIAARSGASSSPGPRVAYVEASDLPDYLPPFLIGSARADADGDVWVRVAQAAPTIAGAAVYDVIDRSGTRIDRIQIPPGNDLVGFGPGVAYLAMRVDGGRQIARARIH